MTIVVSDAGPLIALSRISKLHLLREFFNEITIPQEIFEEVCVKGIVKPGAEEITNASWIKREKVKDRLSVELLELELDKGEAEVITLAKELKADLVVIDERIPREMLKLLGFNVVGTVGIIVQARQRGFINDVKIVLDELRKKGMWIDDNVYNQALKM